MEVNSLAERILSDINVVFKKVPEIDEFDILPVSDVVQNKCPVICVNQKVALEGWCVKHVYLYSYSRLMQWRHSQQKIDPTVVLGWTRAVLLINPDVQTAWNIRKELVFSGVQNIEDELKFSELILSRKPKCPDVFAHRKLLLQKLQEREFVFASTIKLEFEVCSRAAERYSNNYYAWSHRIWIIQELAKSQKEIAIQELKSTESWVRSHISDHSGFHYRQFLITTCLGEKINFDSQIPRLIPRSQEFLNKNRNNSSVNTANDGITVNKEILSLLQQELVLISDLICSFPGHETLWYHRRFVVSTLCHYCHSSLNSVVPNCVICVDISRVKKSKLEIHTEIKFYLEEEQKFVKKCLLLNEKQDWQYHLAKKHIDWVQNILSLSFSIS